MVQDKSRDFLDTWDFLETRISDIKDLGKIYDDVNISSERYLVLFSYHFTLSLSLSLSLSLLLYTGWQVGKRCSSICLGWSQHCE